MTARAVSPASVFGQRKMAALLVLGFSSGIPLYLTERTLQAWMTKENVDLTTIGLFSLVALPYTLKFLWAPFIDRFVPPFMGRRRGWLLITQIALFLAIAAMSLHDPRTGLQMLALNAVLIAFVSASQDIAGDAYRRDVLDDRELGAGASLWVTGYRMALIVTGSLAFLLADRMPWPAVYAVMGGLMAIGVVGSFMAPEPAAPTGVPSSLQDAVIKPFAEFFRRTGIPFGVVVLMFIVLYRYSDGLAGNMATPFLLQIGFSQTEVGAIFGGIGLAATIVGTLLGGAVVAWIGLNRSLWIFAVLQAVTNLLYYWLSTVGNDRSMLVGVIVVENVSQGLVNAAFLSYLMAMCDRRFSATQFALLSSLFATTRSILVAPAGRLVEAVGWPLFFLITVAAVIPTMLLLPLVAPLRRDGPRAAAGSPGGVAPA